MGLCAHDRMHAFTSFTKRIWHKQTYITCLIPCHLLLKRNTTYLDDTPMVDSVFQAVKASDG